MTIPRSRESPNVGEKREFDLVVLGSGAAGLTTAVVAAHEGLDVLVLEKTDYLGGTTAYSAGTCWIPNNRFQQADGVLDDADQARRYLDALVGDRSPRQQRETYLAEGPKMIDYMHDLGVEFWPSKTVVDYHPELPGAGLGGRALEPAPFDGRTLGRVGFSRVRPPVPEFALFGGSLMVRRAEVNRLLKIYRGSPDALGLALKLGIRWVLDRLRYPRGTRLTMGNALVAHLYHRFLERSGQVWFNARARELITTDGGVEGLIVAHQGREVRIRARLGVVLAGGGFPANPELRERHMPQPAPQFTRAAEGSTGDTIALGRSVGGTLGAPDEGNALWFPSSIGRRRDGSVAVFPHIWDRAKPGLIAVNSAGRRFVDESESYHRFTRAMYAANVSTPAIPTWLILDSRSLSQYGLGMIYPHLPAVFRKKYVANGYLRTGRSIAELADRIGVDPTGLEQTIADNNRHAATGVDVEFRKGDSPFGRQYGDPRHRPNVNLGPITVAPYYAIAVVPTPLATALGLATNSYGQVLSGTGTPITGLYAVGNDASSVMGSQYPGAGCQIGCGMTFGYIAARHAATAGPVESKPLPSTTPD